NFRAGTAGRSATVSVISSIYVLNPTAANALQLTGATTVSTPGLVEVDSSSSRAVVASGSSKVTASSIQVVGGVSISGTGALRPTPVTGTRAVADPFGGLAIPQTGSVMGSVSLHGTSTLTIYPGVYSSISVSGNARLTMNPGVYVIAGGGFAVS